MRKESGNGEFMSRWCLKQTCPREGVSPAVPGRRQKEQIQRSWGRRILDTSKQWVLTRVVLLRHPQRTSGKAWGCFLSSQCGTATVIYWVEPRDATKHSTMYRTTPLPRRSRAHTSSLEAVTGTHRESLWQNSVDDTRQTEDEVREPAEAKATWDLVDHSKDFEFYSERVSKLSERFNQRSDLIWPHCPAREWVLGRQGWKQGQAAKLQVRGSGHHGGGGDTWVSEYNLKVEWEELTYGLGVWDERNREGKEDTSFWPMPFTEINMTAGGRTFIYYLCAGSSLLYAGFR